MSDPVTRLNAPEVRLSPVPSFTDIRPTLPVTLSVTNPTVADG